MLTIKQLLIFHRLWITQLFTYLVTDSATPSFTFCKMIDMPHFVGGTPQNVVYNPEIRTQVKIFVQSTYPSRFIILRLIIQKLLC